ncbi:MAG: ABC transporter permease [Promethearchaeota archaeon]
MYLSGLIRKEFGRIKSDKRTLALIFIIPIILIIIFGLTSGGGPTEYFNAAIITRDNMPYEDSTLQSNSTLNYDEVFIDIVEDECSAWGLIESYDPEDDEEYEEAFKECMELLKNEVIDVFIILDEDFSETVENETDTTLTYYIDGSDLEAVDAVEVAIQEPIGLFKVEVRKTVNFVIMAPYLEYEVPFWETQVLNYALALVLSMLILGLLMNLTSLSIVSEGPLSRMMLTPTAKNEIILSKLIANSVIMLLQVTIIFALSAIFGMFSLGSLFNLYLILIATGFCGICMGLFISSISKTEQVANQLYIMFFIALLMFSGAFIKMETLPLAMQIIIYSLPLSHAVPLINDITKRGAPIDFFHFLSLNLISMVFIIMAYIAFRFRKVEV